MSNVPIDLVETKAIYVRTSTSDQDGAAQLHALHRAATARGWSSVLEYTDLGHSGAKAVRITRAHAARPKQGL